MSALLSKALSHKREYWRLEKLYADLGGYEWGARGADYDPIPPWVEIDRNQAKLSYSFIIIQLWAARKALRSADADEAARILAADDAFHALASRPVTDTRKLALISDLQKLVAA